MSCLKSNLHGKGSLFRSLWLIIVCTSTWITRKLGQNSFVLLAEQVKGWESESPCCACQRKPIVVALTTVLFNLHVLFQFQRFGWQMERRRQRSDFDGWSPCGRQGGNCQGTRGRLPLWQHQPEQLARSRHGQLQDRSGPPDERTYFQDAQWRTRAQSEQWSEPLDLHGRREGGEEDSAGHGEISDCWSVPGQSARSSPVGGGTSPGNRDPRPAAPSPPPHPQWGVFPRRQHPRLGSHFPSRGENLPSHGRRQSGLLRDKPINWTRKAKVRKQRHWRSQIRSQNQKTVVYFLPCDSENELVNKYIREQIKGSLKATQNSAMLGEILAWIERTPPTRIFSSTKVAKRAEWLKW